MKEEEGKETSFPPVEYPILSQLQWFSLRFSPWGERKEIAEIALLFFANLSAKQGAASLFQFSSLLLLFPIARSAYFHLDLHQIS